MIDIKPQVVFFSDEQQMIDLVRLNLSQNFEVIGATGVADLDEALETLRQVRPDYVLIDPQLSGLDHLQLHNRLQADQALSNIQILIIGEGGLE